jgi:hypothetical protein
MSAGIILGEPFVLTKVPWNENNILNLKNRIRMQSSGDNEKLDILLHSIYDEIQFERALELQDYKSLYSKLSQNAPRLTESILKSALGVKQLMAQNFNEIKNSHRLKPLGLSLQGQPEPLSHGKEHEAYADFLKKSVADSLELPQNVKSKILNYYLQSKASANSGSTARCAQLFQ